MKSEILRFHRVFASGNKEAIHNMNFSLFKGELLGILGLSDSGSSLIVKLLSGLGSIDSGEIYLKEDRLRSEGYRDSGRKSLFCILKKPQLIPNLTVAENIFILQGKSRKLFVDRKAISFKTQELMRKMDFFINSEALAGELTKVQEHQVLIAKAISLKEEVIIIDNIISTYGEEDQRLFMDTIEKVLALGISVILIGNEVTEIMPHCDRIIILREGTKVKTLYREEYSPGLIRSHLVGHNYSSPEDTLGSPATLEKPVFSVRNLYIPGVLIDLSFHLSKGESLGILASEDKHIEALIEGLFFREQGSSGVIFLEEIKCCYKNYIQALRAGIGLIREDGLREGLFNNLSIAENLTFMKFKKGSRCGVINKKMLSLTLLEFQKVLEISGDIKVSHTSTLSRYTRRRIVLYRWLLKKPKVLIIVKPYSGIDFMERQELKNMIELLKEQGTGIIVLSISPGEAMGLCSRVIDLSKERVLI